MDIFFQFFLVTISCLWIMQACNPFEEAADYLGRNMKAGTKGATINAIASSMPELLTTIVFLFFYHDKAGFAAGIGTTAGSAVFNMALIPAMSIIAVFLFVKGIKFNLSKACIIRDGAFLIIAEGTLIWFLSNEVMEWYHGMIMIGIYGVYMTVMLLQNKMIKTDNDVDVFMDDSDEKDVEQNKHHWFVNFCKFDYKNMIHRNCEYSTKSAIFALTLAVLNICGACYLLAECVVNIADFFNMNTFFVAVIVAAAATSVPDTVISFKDAMKGNHDDSISNAVGSNIFDICICLGLPLTAFAFFYGPIEIPQADGVAELRIILLAFSALVIALLLFTRVTLKTSMILIAGYLSYASYSWCRGMNMLWANNVSELIKRITGI